MATAQELLNPQQLLEEIKHRLPGIDKKCGAQPNTIWQLMQQMQSSSDFDEIRPDHLAFDALLSPQSEMGFKSMGFITTIFPGEEANISSTCVLFSTNEERGHPYISFNYKGVDLARVSRSNWLNITVCLDGLTKKVLINDNTGTSYPTNWIYSFYNNGRRDQNSSSRVGRQTLEKIEAVQNNPLDSSFAIRGFEEDFRRGLLAFNVIGLTQESIAIVIPKQISFRINKQLRG